MERNTVFSPSVEVSREGGDAALGDLRVLVLVLADAVEVLNVAGTAQQLHKVLVVGDDQQLEVALSRAALDDSGNQRTGSDLPKTRPSGREPRLGSVLTLRAREPGTRCCPGPGWWWARPGPGSHSSGRRFQPEPDG